MVRPETNETALHTRHVNADTTVERPRIDVENYEDRVCARLTQPLLVSADGSSTWTAIAVAPASLVPDWVPRMVQLVRTSFGLSSVISATIAE
jgi:hypothetical protein